MHFAIEKAIQRLFLTIRNIHALIAVQVSQLVLSREIDLECDFGWQISLWLNSYQIHTFLACSVFGISSRWDYLYFSR